MELERERSPVRENSAGELALTTPKALFEKLNSLKPNEIMQYINENCFPGSECYETIMGLDIDSMTFNDKQYAFACQALITDNIPDFGYSLVRVISFLKTNHPKSSLIKSLSCIELISIFARSATTDKPQTEEEIQWNKQFFSFQFNEIVGEFNKRIPCYVNYSGFHFNDFNNVEDINFSNSNCRNTIFSGMEVKGCDFSNANMSGAKFDVIGEGCVFTNAIFEGATFRNDEGMLTSDNAEEYFDKLHTFLSKSKGRDTLKQAIILDVLVKIRASYNLGDRDVVAFMLYNHPLCAEHRNSFSRKFSVANTNTQKTVMALCPDAFNEPKEESRFSFFNRDSKDESSGYEEQSSFWDRFRSFNSEEGNHLSIFEWIQSMRNYDDEYYHGEEKKGCAQQ